MEVENPYMKVLQHNEKEKAAAVVIPKEILEELALLNEKNVKQKEKKVSRKQITEATSTTYKMRLRKKGAESDNFHPFRRISPRLVKQARRGEESLADVTVMPSIEEENSRRPEGPLRLQDCVQSVDKEGWEKYVSDIGCYPPPLLSTRAANVGEVKGKSRWWVEAMEGKGCRAWAYPNKGTETLDRFKERVSKLSMWCGGVARLLTERITSIAVHPSKDKLVIAAGGKDGSLGLWIVNPALSVGNGVVKAAESQESATGIYRFEPHSAQINCSTFCEFRADRLITSSYDGTVRSLNFEKLVYDEVLSSPRDMKGYWMQWHCQLSANVLLASQGSGNVYVVDDRSSSRHEAVLGCYDRSCRTVSLHPQHPMYLATCSSLGLVTVWDLRKFSRKSAKVGVESGASICQLSIHGRLSSAFFSPVTGSGLLTTSSNDCIRIYDTSKLVEGNAGPCVFRVETDIKHMHKTWSWLTPMRAAWHPQRDDAFVVGSLANPRRVEVFGRHGRMLCALGQDGHFPINTVCPVNAFHPNRMVLASADSGGRVHILL